MKRTLKRLALRTESIRQLTPSALSGVVGGIIKSSINDTCSYTNQQCATGTESNSWCTSNLCPPGY